jgi:hypothetical protein
LAVVPEVSLAVMEGVGKVKTETLVWVEAAQPLLSVTVTE